MTQFNAQTPGSMPPLKKTVIIDRYENMMFLFDPVEGFLLLEKTFNKDEIILKAHGYVNPNDIDPIWQQHVMQRRNATAVTQLGIAKLGLLDDTLRHYENKVTSDGTIIHLLMLEYPPRMVPITFKSKDDPDGKIVYYNLPMPYVQFHCCIKELASGKLVFNLDSYMTCTKTPIKSMNEYLYKIPTTNVRDHGHICWGHDDSSIEEKSILRLAQRMVTTFFSLNFNEDLNKMLFTYKDWNNKPLEWILTQDWGSPHDTMTSMIQRLRKNYDK